MTEQNHLELAARKAAVAACSFVAAGEQDLATHVLSYFLLEAETAGYSRLVAMSALVGQLISVVVATAPMGALASMSLALGSEAT
jgi:hypothetical protein